MRPGEVLAFQRKAVGYVCVCFIEDLSVLIFFNHALFELNKGVWFNYSDSGLLGHLDIVFL